MNDTTLSILGRVVERLMIIVAGIVLVVLGYYLFLNGVGGEAKIRVDTAGQMYQLENATPGMIFALLGIIVLGRAILSPLKIEATTVPVRAIAGQTSIAEQKSSSSTRLAQKDAPHVYEHHVISYSDPAAMSSGLQLQIVDIHELYSAVFAVASDRSINANVCNALVQAYRNIYEKNKLGPDGAARLRKLREMKKESLTPGQVKEMEALEQRIPEEYSPERF